MHSKITNAVEQRPLPLARPNSSSDVTLDVIMKRRSFLAAINLMFDVSGLEDKEIYGALGIDAGHFSHIRKGKSGVHFPTNKLEDAMDLCDSEIPLIWLSHRRGKGLVMLETEAERLLRIAEERGLKLEDENRILREVIAGRVGARA